MEDQQCQLHSLGQMQLPLNQTEIASQFMVHRVRRMAKRRMQFVSNAAWKATHGVTDATKADATAEVPEFKPGDRVRVKSRDAIRAGLDNWNVQGGCAFMEEMYEYCDTEQVVFKKVEKFLDERDYRTKKVRNTYLLEGLLCEGTVDFGPCDRSCFFFWRAEWLEKVE